MSYETINGRPVIVLDKGGVPAAVDKAEAVIAQNYCRWGLFDRGGFLVRVVLTKGEENRRIKRPTGTVVLRQATVPMLQDILDQAIHWQNGKLWDIDCPARIANVWLSRTGLWRLPKLVGVVHAPVLREDGTVLSEAGYDEITGLLLHSTLRWKAPHDLSKTGVDAAVKTLLFPFSQFPISPEGKSVIISAILTALQRRLLYSAPAHAFDAPTQGSGKSLLADCVSIIATGFEAVTTSATTDTDEFRKKLVSLLLAGDLIYVFDNIIHPLRSDALASILTQPSYQDRILGHSQMSERLPTNMLCFLTGNNLTFSGDLPSRVIVARIEPECEKPELRSFQIKDLRAYVRAHRIELVEAGLTILQAYHAAGRPSQNLRPFGRFEQWSDEIRSALVSAGLSDPCLTRESVEVSDPEREHTLALFNAWNNAATKPILLQALIDGAGESFELRAALLTVAADADNQDRVSTRRLAAWCRQRVGKVVGDFKLVRCADARAGFATWQVISVQSNKIVVK